MFRLLLSRFRRSPKTSSSLEDAIAEIEVYLVGALGATEDDYLPYFQEPAYHQEMERRFRQLTVWVRLLLETKSLFRPLTRRRRKVVRNLLGARLELIADFHEQALAPLTSQEGTTGRDMTRKEARRLAASMVRTLTELRAVLLHTIYRVDLPYSERIRDDNGSLHHHGFPEPQCPAEPVRVLRPQSTESTRLGMLAWARSELVMEPATQMVRLCVDTLGLPSTLPARPQDRRWD